jgi:hypothetical protein
LNFVFYLDHLGSKLIDQLTTVAAITAIVEVGLLVGETTKGVVKLEGVEEGVDSLEVITASVDLVNNIFETDNADRLEVLLNQGVVRESNTLALNLGVTTLVEKVSDGLAAGNTPSDERSDLDKHRLGSTIALDKGGVVNLAKSEELQDLAGLGRKTEGTKNTDDKENVSFLGDEELLLVLSMTAETDLVTRLRTVAGNVLLSTLEDDLSSLLLLGLLFLLGSNLGGEAGLDILALLEISLGGRAV